MREARRFIVRGRVQGVSYRWFTREAALRHGLVGWARNLTDGTVEVQVAGEPAEITSFLEELRRGPRMAQVEEIVEEALAEDPGWQGFEIRRTS